ncbi:MAG TPA: metallophosphoesterase family protein [Bacteroidales bacterium]|nr:metallophosphoesterase family protein [Bacteroidales bacterium]
MSEPRRFVIGDIHGCYLTFRTLVEEVLRLEKEDTLFLLGDYIDRGPSSREVIDYITELRDHGYQVKPVMGNHEYMLLKSLDDPEYFRLWIMNGCASTLASFGVAASRVHDRESVQAIPESYIRFFAELPLYEETNGYLIVHAGIPKGTDSIAGHAETVLWTREESFSREILGNRVLVHGHTPVSIEMIRGRVQDPGSRVINLDAGCIYNRFPTLGNLAALDLDSRELHFLKNREP